VPIGTKIGANLFINKNIMSEETNQKTEKATKHIKQVGTFSQILGWWKIIAATILPVMLTGSSELSEFLNYSYSDLSLNIVLGIILIILGSRIKKDIHKSTKKYVWVILILSGIFGFINIAMGGKTSIMFLLFAYSIYALTQFKHVKISDEKPKYKITGKKWVLLMVAFVLIFGAGLVIDLNQYGYFIDEENIALPDTDKNSDNYEQIGNLYRNNKYGFRIKFPEGWEQQDGDGPHVLRKASKDGHSINILVQELPKEYASLIDENMNVKDLYSLGEFKNTAYEGITEKFKEAKVIDYGEINIDNIPAYWISYQTPYSTMGVSFEGIMINYQIFHKNNFYTITIGSSKDEFPSVESILKQSVSTFVFEK